VGYSYFDAPREIKLILDEIVRSYYGIFKDNLVGIYLHGSLALGCFNPKVSDIDFLIVARDKLSLEVKREVVKN
jgi:streptomycin 3"-adenylyltransferase